MARRFPTTVRIVLLTLLAAWLAGCGGFGSSARVTIYEDRQRPSDRVPMRAYSRIPRSGLHTVLRDDTVHTISRRYGVPVRAIIEANGLRAPYRLVVGRKIRLPATRGHTVARGDTVYGIARRYGVGMSALVRLNGIKKPYTILVGQRLRLPVKIAARQTAGEERSQQRTSSRQRVARAPVPELRPPPRKGKGFLWPVRGRVLSGFGPMGKGLHNDGINLAAPRGAPVRAAENGVVAYSGNELRGFGNLVLVKHSGGVMTAYAHNGKLLVSRGDRVERGQTIARVGSTGNVATPQLHFEVRRGRRAVDPTRYLQRQTSRRAG